MRQLISAITEQILRQMKTDEVNMVRLERFDNPIIYRAVCENLQQSSRVRVLVPKITVEKYRQFVAENNPNWQLSLTYLHKGDNSAFDAEGSSAYAQKSYVDLEQAITKWRNEAPNLEHGALVLLMGTEAAPDDTGSLKDTTFVISPRELITWLSSDYSAWYQNVLVSNGIESNELKAAIRTLYRTIFSRVNINLFRLSDFIDSLYAMQFGSGQDLIEYICETLNTTWGIPSVLNTKYVPKVSDLNKGRLSDAKIITKALDFIERKDDIPSGAAMKKLLVKFDKFAEDNGIIESNPFPEDTEQFSSYEAFRQCVLDFMRGIDLKKNREILLKVDYAIIEQILGTKIGAPAPKDKPTTLTGEPMEAYTRMFLKAASEYSTKFGQYPTEFSVRVDSIHLPDCIENQKDNNQSNASEAEQKEDAFANVCTFLGGILQFLNSAGIECDENTVTFNYENGIDPFDFSNRYQFFNKIHGTGKWGDPGKIAFTVKAVGNTGTKNYEFKWVFSPYSPWLNAFSFLRNSLFSNVVPDSYTLPTMVVCKNIQDYLHCESEDEFYAHLIQLDADLLYDSHLREISRYFAQGSIHGRFTSLCQNFKGFALKLVDHGLFNALLNLRNVVEAFSQMMKEIHQNYASLTDIQREKIGLLLNCFMITSNSDVVNNSNMAEVLLPAYHPILLEKIDAKQIFIRDGFAEIMQHCIANELSKDKQIAKMDSLVQLSTITQGTDVVLQKTNTYVVCKNMWEYYGVYYTKDNTENPISGNAFGNSIVTDDEEASAMLQNTPISNVVKRNIWDYIRTFPARVDGLNVAFVAPTDMQHIVAAIHGIAKQMEREGLKSTINLKIICMNSKKNSASYLRRWLDSYFDEGRDVTVNTFLRTTGSTKTDVDNLSELLKNCDLCFVYNILQNTNVQFDMIGEELIKKEDAKFPMSFTPDTIPATHGKSRKINISQYQFDAAKHHTQANFVAGNPNSVPGVYRTFMTLELMDAQYYLIEMCHKKCNWVVCVDAAIDRRMLEAGESRIIGFTTGEGSYGELNVTVSAHKKVLDDIKEMLVKRIHEKFGDWSAERLQKAAKFCIDEMSRYMDGSRILKALNPYDYEIHSFLAYVLSLQMLGITAENDEYAVQTLISLDSYKHWFAEDDERNKDNKRPDFMLIEIPKNENNLDPNKNLQIRIKIIECKMGFQNDYHLEKAQTQLEKGIWTMSHNWNPSDRSIMHRYWLNQLYRAIIFSPIMMDNTTPEYRTIRNKIYGILNGNYELEWSGDIFAFWLNSDADAPDEWQLESDLAGELFEDGIELSDLTCHCCGQMFIQKMLVPPEERTSIFSMNPIVNPEDELPDSDENEDEDEDTLEDDVVLPAVGTGESIPSASVVYLPFLDYLNDGKEHTRKESLEWFAAYFKIDPLDKKLVYESNGHFKWETVLDDVITLFRKHGVLENSIAARFHATDLGARFATYAASLPLTESFLKALGTFVAAQNTDHDNGGDDTQEPSLEVDDRENKQPPEGDNINTMRPPLSEVRFLIGEDVRTKEKFYWEFGNKSLNNRHLLINGNSGCGKTYCIQTLLMEMVRSGVSGVVFDYTSGFTRDKLDPVFTNELGDRLQQRVVYLNKIPANPFAKQTIKVGGIEAPERDVDVATRVANVFTTVYGFGGQQKSALYKAIRNGLKKHKDAMSFAYLEDELLEVSQKQAETVLSKIQSFLDYEPFAADEVFDWGSIRDSDGMVYIMQLDGFDRPTQLLLTELLLWDIWNYCVKNGNEEHPFVIVLDEAQNLSHDSESPSAKFLTEGRKFGISAWYATQFMKPQLSDDEIQRLQQAGQKLYFCPPDDGVMPVAKNIDIDAQGAKEWAPKLKALKKGECVTCGNMVRNGRWNKYDPRIIRVTSLPERLKHD